MAKRNLPLGGAIPMEPGERTAPVTIQKLNTVAKPGFPKEEWSTLASLVWMRKLEVKGREQFASDQESAAAETQWEMGYRSDMDPDLVDVPNRRRLLYQGRVYNIRAASLIGQREGVELITLAKVG